MNSIEINQPEFFEPHELGTPEELALLGVSSGRQADNSQMSNERRAAILSLAAMGFGVRKISIALKVSDHCVTLAIRQAESDVATLKERVSEDFLRDADEIRRSYMDDLRSNRADPDKKPVAAAIFADKALVLAGEATQITEHRISCPGLADLQSAMGKLPKPAVVECVSECRQDGEPQGVDNV